MRSASLALLVSAAVGLVSQGTLADTPLPAPGGIAPHQPNPHWETARRLGLWMLVAAAAWFALVVFAAARNRGQRLYQTSLVLAPRAPGDADPVVFSPPISMPVRVSAISSIAAARSPARTISLPRSES